MILTINKPKIIATYRIKNGEEWIKKSIESILGLCSEIVIVDHSTDSTLEICSQFKQVVDVYHTQNREFDETRDKNELLVMAKKRNPDFILNLDADEIMMPHSTEIILNEINVLYKEFDAFRFQVLNLWDSPNQFRYDGVLKNVWASRLLRMENQPDDLVYDETPFPGNAHCIGIPQKALGMETSVRSKAKILHYGIFSKKMREQKHQFYNELDSDNTFYDGYDYIISSKSHLSGMNGYEFKKLPKELIFPIP